MTDRLKKPATWTLVLSGLFAIMELGVSVSLWLAPESVLEQVDLNAKGVSYVVQMWAARQFALGVIFGYATLKKSAAMLTIAYVFFLVMFVGDLVVGIVQEETPLIISSVVMMIVSAALLVVLRKRN